MTTNGAGFFHSLYGASGYPGAGANPSPGINGAAITTLAGQIPYSNPSSGTKYLVRFSAGSSQPGYYFLYDLLWQNSNVNLITLTAQSISMPSLPARDVNGTSNGEGVEAWLQVYSGTGNIVQLNAMTISYTNSAGVSGRTGTVTVYPIGAATGLLVPFNLQAGDTGVRSIQSLTLGALLTSGNVGLMLVRPLAGCSVLTGNTGCQADLRNSGVRAFDNTVPFLALLASGNSSGQTFGFVNWTVVP